MDGADLGGGGGGTRKAERRSGGRSGRPSDYPIIFYNWHSWHSRSGKSTLSQYVCTHEEDSMHFNIVIWVHVSQNFSVQTILREMIEQVTGKPSPQFDSANALQKN